MDIIVLMLVWLSSGSDEKLILNDIKVNDALAVGAEIDLEFYHHANKFRLGCRKKTPLKLSVLNKTLIIYNSNGRICSLVVLTPTQKNR